MLSKGGLMKRLWRRQVGTVAIASWLSAAHAYANEGDLTVVIDSVQNLETRTFTRESGEWADRCIPDPGPSGTTYRILPFSFFARNIGNGDIVVGRSPTPLCPHDTCPCPEGSSYVQDGPYEWSPSHCHWHLREFNSYSLLRASGAEVRKGNKQAFCLMDSTIWNPNVSTDPKYGCEEQGVSVGFQDEYPAGLTCQFLIVDNVTTGQSLPDGEYRLVATTNALPIVSEANIHNNSASVPLRKWGKLVRPISGSWQAAQTIAAEGAEPKAPKLVSARPNRVDAFWVDGSGHLQTATKSAADNGAFGVVADLGAPSTGSLARGEGDLAVTSWGPGRIDVVARGSDGRLWHRRYAEADGWSSWDNPSSAAGVAGALSMNSWAPERLDIVWSDSAGNLFHIAWLGASWSIIDPLGHPGTVIRSTTIVAAERNRLDVFAAGDDRRLWHIAWGGESFGGWDNPGGVADVSGLPSVSSWAPGRLDVLWISSSANAVKHLAWDGRWSSVRTLQPPRGVNVQNGSPALVAWGYQRLDAFVRSKSNRLYQLSFDGSRWEWKSAPSPKELNSSPHALSWAANQLSVAYGVSGGALAVQSWF